MSGELPEELPAGFEFGPYLIHACIGRGGMARVYRAEQAALHRSVALKVLDRWALDEPSGRERFVREARAAASIKHPNVVDILDVGVWQERPYIVMELLTGHDLDSYLDQYGVLSEAEIARIALPVIAGMMAVHEAGVVHRDLKPSNIFLADGPEGEVIPKVLDFGVSKFSNNLTDPLRRATKTREIVGTPAYMAPEALNGVRELGPAADQYALGAVLYECAVGRPPFEGETLLELLMAVASGKIERPSVLRPEMSAALERTILRAISNDPRARFETLRDMGRALWPLADARMQAIWERSFGGGPPVSRRDAPTVVGSPDDMPTLTRHLRWRLNAQPWFRPVALAAGLGALLGVGAIIYEASQSPEVSNAATAPAAPAPTTLVSKAPSVAPAAAPSTPTPSPSSDTERERAETPAVRSIDRSVSSLRSSRETSRPRRAAATRTAPRARPERSRLAKSDAMPEVSRDEPRAAATRPSNEIGMIKDELDGLFTQPREGGQPAAAQTDAELDGLFAVTKSATHGANGAPIPE